jgi:hypothetical protein
MTPLHTRALALSLALAACSANALAARDPGDDIYFGRLDGAAALKPEVVNVAPIQVTGGPSTSEPLYLHVRANAQKRWTAACTYYDACATPVHFVTEHWYRSVYLPAVGGSNGMEQRYRDTVREERTERDTGRHRHSD